MNTEKLKNGMIVKNYREMCMLLEEKEKTGNAKKAQLKEWTRHFRFDKDGHKFIIQEIFETPVPKGFRPDDIYTEDINIILKYMLLNNNKYGGSNLVCTYQYFTMQNLLISCGFTNERWGKFENINNFAEDNEISYKQAMYLYNRLYTYAYSYCVKNITRSLERLRKRGYIKTNDVLRVNIVRDNKFNKRDAELKEEIIYDIVSGTLKEEMNIKMLNIYNWDEYYKKLNERLNEYGIYGALKQLAITYNEELAGDCEISKEEYDNSLKNINANTLVAMRGWIEREVRKDIGKIVDCIGLGSELLELFYSDGIRELYQDVVNYFVTKDGNEKILAATAENNDNSTDWLDEIA